MAKIAGGDPNANQQLTQYYLSCIVEASRYFKDKFDNNLKLAMAASKSARYFDPVKDSELKPSSNDIDDLKLLSFFDNGVTSGLKSELPQYLAAAEDVSADTAKLQWREAMRVSSLSGRMPVKLYY